MLIKTFTEVTPEILAAQAKEKEYKGTINRSLYLIFTHSNGDVVRRVHWKLTSEDILIAMINNAKADINITKLQVINEYNDWKIDVFVR